jgi:signal transduction histidine kinase
MSENAFQVLLVEDNAGDAVLLKTLLGQSPVHFQVKHAVELRRAVEELAREKPDAVLLDLGLPDSQGLDTLSQTRKSAPGTPVVVLTGRSDSELGVQALQKGAQDYLVKGTVETHALSQSLRYAIERQRLQAETEQLRLEQIALKDEFLSHVSHELRSPLNVIYQFVSILSDGLAGELKPQQSEYLQIIFRNVQQLQSMIGELLDVTRAGAGKLSVDLQSTDVHADVEDAVQSLKGVAASKGVALSAEVPPDLPPAYADPDRLRQVMVNLMENAIKFTPQGGKVHLSVAPLAESPPTLKFSVSDTGCGISPELSEKIFERLYQVTRTDGARTGLGLGLYICRELVTRQGGRIWVEKSSPEGSTFCFTVPELSLEQMLSPILSQDLKAGTSIALIRVELGSPDRWTSKGERETAFQQTRQLLGRSLLHPVDVILPKMRSDGESEFLFALAVTEPKGADVIVDRIQKKLGRDELLSRSGLRFGVERRMISVRTDHKGDAKTESAACLANDTRDQIESWKTVGGTNHE